MTPPPLDYVALNCRDANALQALLCGPLGLGAVPVATAGDDVLAVALGQTLLLLFEPGDLRLDGATQVGLHHLGFASDAPEEHGRRLGLEPQRLRNDLHAPQIELNAAQCAGTRVRLGPALPRPGTAASGVVERLDHIGIASADNAHAESIFVDRFGYPVESRQTDLEVRSVIESFTSDRYGVVHQARRPEAVGGLRVSFVTVGDCELEFLQEFDRDAMSASRAAELGQAPGTTRQDQGAVGRFVERRGAGLHHLAIKTPDIDALLSSLSSQGFRVIDSVGRPGSRRARIGFVHPSSSGGILIHFVQRVPLEA